MQQFWHNFWQKVGQLQPLRYSQRSLLFVLILMSGVLLVRAQPLLPLPGGRAAITVTTTADTPDSAPGDGICADTVGNCSLRAAVQTANLKVGADHIVLPAGTYTLSRLGQEDLALNGDLDVLDDLTLEGTAAATTFIDASQLDNAIEIPSFNGIELTLTIAGVTLKGASGPGQYAIDVSSSGTLYLSSSVITGNYGGVRIYGDASITTTSFNANTYETLLNGSSSTMILADSQFTGNSTSDDFGGILDNFGTMIASNLTLTGNDHAGSGTVYNNDGLLTLKQTVITNNTVGNDGGGIYNAGSNAVLTLTDALIQDNTASDEGGGIYNFEGTMTLTNVTINHNTADPDGYTGNGGGILNWGVMTVNNSTISNNTASGYLGDGNGGGIYTWGDSLKLNNVTLSGNTADDPLNDEGGGGGIYAASSSLPETDLNNVTITNNIAGFGGGVFVEDVTIRFKNTIIAGNIANQSHPDCNDDFDTITSQGNNLLGNATGCSTFTGTGDQLNVNPLLSPLADNGGPAWTHALQSGSTAINAGGASCLTTDQRYAARVGVCDIGAYEFGGTAPTATPTATPSPTASPVTPTVTPGGPTVTPTLTPTPVPGQLQNTGFETQGATKNDAAYWKGAGLDNDKRVCNKVGKPPVSHSGECAFRFKAGLSSNLSQKVSGISASVDDAVTLGLWITGKNYTGTGKASAKIKFNNDTKFKISIDLATGTYDYAEVGGAGPVTAAIANIKVKIETKGGSGKLSVDDVSLTIVPPGALLPAGALVPRQ